MAKTTKAKKNMRRKGHRGGLSTKGKGRRVNDIAAVSETFAFNPTTVSGTIFADYSCSLFQHERARAVAQGYQEFRIKLVEYKFKPLADTFAAGSGSTVPYFYYLIDRARSNNGLVDAASFKAAGAKPIRMDDKTITVKYRPSVLYDTYDAGTLTSLPRNYKLSPWLATNDNSTIGLGFVPSQVDHNGIRWYVEMLTGEVQYLVERVVHIEFRKPLWVLPPTVSALPVVQAESIMTVREWVPKAPVTEEAQPPST